MMENRVILNGSDFDKTAGSGFKAEIVMIDYDGTVPKKYKANEKSNLSSADCSLSYKDSTNSSRNKASNDQENDDRQ
ncbi:hypothetical protein Hanom_Chr01g00058111 [Helianthus anomalus]